MVQIMAYILPSTRHLVLRCNRRYGPRPWYVGLGYIPKYLDLMVGARVGGFADF